MLPLFLAAKELKVEGKVVWKDNITEGMRFLLNIAHRYHQDLLMKKEGWKGSDKPTAIKETTFGKMIDKLPFGKNCKQIWLPSKEWASGCDQS